MAAPPDYARNSRRGHFDNAGEDARAFGATQRAPDAPAAAAFGSRGYLDEFGAVGIAKAYSEQVAHQGMAKLDQYVSSAKLKQYFDVDNLYVGKKLLLVLFPFLQQRWSFRHTSGNEKVVSPRDSVNAIDLYIPVMAVVTYILTSGWVLGIQNRFSPEELGLLCSTTLAWLLAENLLITAIRYAMVISETLNFWDTLAYSGYKYVGMIVSLLAYLAGGSVAYFYCLCYCSLAISFFLARSLKVHVADGRSYEEELIFFAPTDRRCSTTKHPHDILPCLKIILCSCHSKCAAFPMGGSWILTHIISLCYVSLIYLVKGQSLCPIDYYGKPHNAPLYGGYSDEYTCVSFVPRFCMSQFLDGHLMNWDKEDLSRIKRYNLLMHTESVSVLNGRILLDRVYFTDTRPGQRGCSPLEYCVWYVDAFNRFFGLWDDWYVGSSFLEDLKSQNWKEKSSDETVVIDDLYACNDLKFDYFACQHKKYPPCKVRKEKKCHYSPNKYGLPCDEESTETCPCPCSGVPNEWSSWSATCGTTTREDDVKHEEDCKNYAFNSSVNLRLEDCYRGRKGADVHGHLQCVCDPGFTDLLCATELNNCESNPCKNGATCESTSGIFLCHCKPGWLGYLCEERTKECKKIATCENGGTCIENAGAFSCKCPETFGGHRCEYKVSWCNDTTCNGRGICVNITSLLTWRCYCDSGFTGSQCQMVKKSTSSVRRSTEETVRSSIRIWIILIMVLTGTVLLLGIGASYTAKKRRRYRRQHHSASSSVRRNSSRRRRGKWREPVSESSSSCISSATRTNRRFSHLTRNMFSSLKKPEPNIVEKLNAYFVEVSWCNETTCNGRGICVNITSLLTWRCFCDRSFTGRQCQIVEGKIGIVTRSTKEAVGSSARIWIILVMVFTGMVLFGVGALYTTKKRRRHRRHHRSASSSVRQGLSRGRRGKWREPVNQYRSSCISTAKPTKRGFSLLTRDMCSSLKKREPVRNKPNRWRTQPST
uniref:EGF-like domain-containing protein n=1 Tax=Trichuris muris TaxID=70415 RepID=A0A5S6QWI8_TRIMR